MTIWTGESTGPNGLDGRQLAGGSDADPWS